MCVILFYDHQNSVITIILWLITVFGEATACQKTDYVMIIRERSVTNTWQFNSPHQWCNSPQWARVSSLPRFHDHTQFDTSYLIGFLWTSDQPVAETSPDNTQHSQETDIHAPVGFETTDAAREGPQTHVLRLRGHWDPLTILQAMSLLLWHFCIILNRVLLHERVSQSQDQPHISEMYPLVNYLTAQVTIPAVWYDVFPVPDIFCYVLTVLHLSLFPYLACTRALWHYNSWDKQRFSPYHHHHCPCIIVATHKLEVFTFELILTGSVKQQRLHHLHTIFSQFNSVHSNITKFYSQQSHQIVYKNFATWTQSCCIFKYVTHHVDTAVMPRNCIRVSGHPTRVFSWIFSISPDECRDSNRKHAKTTRFQVRDFLPSLPTMNDPLSSVSLYKSRQ